MRRDRAFLQIFTIGQQDLSPRRSLRQWVRAGRDRRSGRPFWGVLGIGAAKVRGPYRAVEMIKNKMWRAADIIAALISGLKGPIVDLAILQPCYPSDHCWRGAGGRFSWDISCPYSAASISFNSPTLLSS